MRGDSVCRACLRDAGSEPEALRHIFRSKKRLSGRTVSCADMLAACGPYAVTESDGFPVYICLQCYKKLCSAYKFRILCESSYLGYLNYSTCNLKLETAEGQENGAGLNGTDTSAMEEVSKKLKCEDKTLGCNADSLFKSENDMNSSTNFEDDVKYLIADEFIDVKSEEELDDKEKKEKKRLKKTIKKLAKKKETGKKKHHKFHTCMLCPKTFKWKHILDSHLDSHYGIKRYFCEECKKDYRNEKDHKNFHRRGFKFQCDTCAKRFNTKAKLTIHQETHSTERVKFFCEEEGCGKVFLSLNGLDRHKLSHIGLKNFICQMCSKSFIDKYQLEVHVRVHTGDRRYPCQYCEKKFITTSARNSHQRWHTKTKNYICPHCEKAFVSSSGLKRHTLCHTKELPQECRFCGKKFARFDNKKRHEMSTHQFTEKCTLPSINTTSAI